MAKDLEQPRKAIESLQCMSKGAAFCLTDYIRLLIVLLEIINDL